MRLWCNLFHGLFQLPRWFPESRMREIRDAIAAGELHHAGELCFAVEARYTPWAVLSGIRHRQRAEQVFSALRIWDTEANSGVLLYLQLAERKIEIVADRGIASRVPASEWQSLCQAFSQDLKTTAPDRAVLNCLARINDLLALHFPAEPGNAQELPNEPVIL